MLAFILAGIVAIGAFGISLLMLFAAGMSDAPSAGDAVGRQALGVLVGGLVLAAAIAGSHWLHMSW